MALSYGPKTTPNLRQANTTSNKWEPSTINNVFSAIMVSIGTIAVWQAHKVHRHSSRTLDQEELVGIQLLSRASTMLSNSSSNVNDNPTALPPRQAASTSYDEENARELPLENGFEMINGADVLHDIVVAGELYP